MCLFPSKLYTPSYTIHHIMHTSLYCYLLFPVNVKRPLYADQLHRRHFHNQGGTRVVKAQHHLLHHQRAQHLHHINLMGVSTSTFGAKQMAPISSSTTSAAAHTPTASVNVEASAGPLMHSTSSSSSSTTISTEPSDVNAPMLPYTFEQLTADYTRKHHPSKSPKWQANLLDTPCAYVVGSQTIQSTLSCTMSFNPRSIFPKHDVSKHCQITELIKLVVKIFKCGSNPGHRSTGF